MVFSIFDTMATIKLTMARYKNVVEEKEFLHHEITLFVRI
jgi:hypothetical protein